MVIIFQLNRSKWDVAEFLSFKYSSVSHKAFFFFFSVFNVLLIEAEMKCGNTLIAVFLSRSYCNPLTSFSFRSYGVSLPREIQSYSFAERNREDVV